VNVQPFLFGNGWIEVKDGDDSCRTIFDRHYSRYHYKDGRKPKLFVGPGEKLVLLQARADALCVWRKFISRDGQQGVNCAIYRNESPEIASGLLLEAMAIAWLRWPGERLYTYVDPAGVPPTMRASRPTWGHCFYQAGWRFCGLTSRRLHILECLPSKEVAA
jgi:hypothetical protein